MRSTARLTAVITFISMLAMLLMLLGCIASFLWLNKQRIETQFNTLTTSLDQALFTRSPQDMAGWLQGVMPVMNIEKLEIYDGNRIITTISRHEMPLVEDSPNRFYLLSARLMHHPSLTLRMTILNPVKTWLASFAGISTFIFMGMVVLAVSVLLIFLHFWLYRQSAGLALLEKRSLEVLKGERRQITDSERKEWPVKVSQAMNTLLKKLSKLVLSEYVSILLSGSLLLWIRKAA